MCVIGFLDSVEVFLIQYIFGGGVVLYIVVFLAVVGCYGFWVFCNCR